MFRCKFSGARCHLSSGVHKMFSTCFTRVHWYITWCTGGTTRSLSSLFWQLGGLLSCRRPWGLGSEYVGFCCIILTCQVILLGTCCWVSLTMPNYLHYSVPSLRHFFVTVLHPVVLVFWTSAPCGIFLAALLLASPPLAFTLQRCSSTHLLCYASLGFFWRL